MFVDVSPFPSVQVPCFDFDFGGVAISKERLETSAFLRIPSHQWESLPSIPVGGTVPLEKKLPG